MRKGFRSSRGAMRGTIGGTLIFVGVVGFATVAIGVGPFVLSYSLVRPTWPRLGILPSIPLGKLSSRLQRSEEHTPELQSRLHLVCRLLLEKKKHITTAT